MSPGGLQFGGRLDRYVGRLFCLSYLTAFLLVVGLYLIIDMTANLDNYLAPREDGTQPSSWIVAGFYGLQLPFLYLQVSPFVTLVAGLFTAAKMARLNELVAALNAGVSSRRILAPVFLGATMLGGGMFLLREWATEELGRRRDHLQDQLLFQRPVPIAENFWVKAEGGRIVRVGEYRPATESAGGPGTPAEIRGLSSRFREGGRSVAIHADRATWDPVPGVWRLEGGQRVAAGDLEQERTPLDELEEVRFHPADAELEWRGLQHPLDLSFSDVRRLLARDPANSQYRTLLHAHLSFPLAGLVLLAVGLPFMVSPERGRAVERIAHGFLLCVAYFGADFVAQTLGMQGQLGPVHAGWLPVLFFGSLGAVLYGSMRS